MKIAILYICTGRYSYFWDNFYISSEKFFLTKHEKHYFVFTDSNINLYNNKRIHTREQHFMGWPNDTLKRFDMFKKIRDDLKKFDYIFFANANMVFLKLVGEEILPDSNELLVLTEHPGFYYYNDNNKFTYERNPKSEAYIPYGTGEHYVCGGFNGGVASAYLNLIDDLSQQIKSDEKNGITALWHDESYLNKYILTHPYKLLTPSYAYPEGWYLPFEKKIMIINKDLHGGHDYLRSITDIPLDSGNIILKLTKIPIIYLKSFIKINIHKILRYFKI